MDIPSNGTRALGAQRQQSCSQGRTGSAKRPGGGELQPQVVLCCTSRCCAISKYLTQQGSSDASTTYPHYSKCGTCDGCLCLPTLLGFVVCVNAQVVLSCTQDDFFARNRFSNFGDLGVAVKTLMDDYQKATRLNENINSIEDMQAFLERQV